MNTKYCPNSKCAQPNYFNVNPPSLCGFCGASLTVSIANAPARPVVQAPKPQPVTKQKPKSSLRDKNIAKLRNRQSVGPDRDDEDLEDDDQDGSIYEVPEIDKLDYVIVGAERTKLTFENLVKQSKTGSGPRPRENTSQAEAIQQFKKEASGKSERIILGDDE